MIKSVNSKRLIFYALFVTLEAALYISFIVLDVKGGQSVKIKYSGIILCLVAAAISSLMCGADGVFLIVAMLFTAVSDVFIFLINDYFEIGLCTFIAVQFVYFARIHLTRGKVPYVSSVLRIILIIAALSALGATNNLTSLTALVAVYFPMLVINAVDSVMLIKISKRYILFFIGLLFFIGCDVLVGLNNAEAVGITLSGFARDFVAVGMWAFYLPSQVFIVLSANATDYKFLKVLKNEK